MQVLSNLYNMSSQARTKHSLQDDKGFSNSIIKHKRISKNLHGKQPALWESVAKNLQKCGAENIGPCDCHERALVALCSGRQPSKSREMIVAKVEEQRAFRLFLWAAVACPMPSCPGRSLPRTCPCASSRERGIFIVGGAGSWRRRRNRTVIFLCSYSTGFSWVSGAALSLPGSASLWVRVYYQDLEHPWHSADCLRFGWVWKSSLGLKWFRANAINCCWLSCKVS